ncbi:hypothetical protein L7E35_004655 [Vibrio parahaemolyticus]|nr:hypothetical protein [Vibrio parahaemolyticus]EIV1599709.1 hypothetical protein [Vibrio parahaemolyticus]
MAATRNFDSILNSRQPITRKNLKKAVGKPTPVVEKQPVEEVKQPEVVEASKTESTPVVENETVVVEEQKNETTVVDEVVEEEATVEEPVVEKQPEPKPEPKVLSLREKFLAEAMEKQNNMINKTEKFKFILTVEAKEAYEKAYGEIQTERFNARLIKLELVKAQIWAIETNYQYVKNPSFNSNPARKEYIRENSITLTDDDRNFFKIIQEQDLKQVFDFNKLYYSLLIAFWESQADA